MPVLILVARGMPLVIMVFFGLFIRRHRGVAMAMFVKIPGGVALVIVVGTGFFSRLLGAHGLSPVVEDAMLVASITAVVRNFLECRKGDAPEHHTRQIS